MISAPEMVGEAVGVSAPGTSPVISSVNAAAGIVGQPFNYRIIASENPASFEATGLPEGLTADATTGLISGTPLVAGSYIITLSATNSHGTNSAQLALTVARASSVENLVSSSLVAPGAGKLQRTMPRSRINWLLMFTVIIPTTLAAIYFGLIASDVYISESRFVVRSPHQSSAVPGGLGSLLSGAAFSRSQDDTFNLHDFLLSRDALKELHEKLNIAQVFGNAGVDPINRFGGLGRDKSFEALHTYYQKRLSIHLESSSAISIMKVSAFAAEDAWRINESLLDSGERFVNQLNERWRRDMIRYATGEVEEAMVKAKAAAVALSSYRSENSVVDPLGQSKSQLALISKLEEKLIDAQALLIQTRSFSPTSPQIPLLQSSSEALRTEINTQMARLASADASSFTSKATDYDLLSLEQDFASKHLMAALAALTQARNDVQSKRLYLERIVQPNKPDVAVEPRKIRGMLTVLLMGLIVWGLLHILVAGVREHRD